jgi:hypothetical protein
MRSLTADPLGAAKVAFGGLHRNVAEQELNLFQLAAGGSAQAGATSTKIVRRELADADFAGKLLNDVPYEFFCHAFTPNSASTTHAAKEAAGGDSSGFRPLVQQTLHPFGYGDGSNVPSLPAKVLPSALRVVEDDLPSARRVRGARAHKPEVLQVRPDLFCP